VDFSFTEDQLAFRDAVRDLLAKDCPPEVVRAAYPEPPADRPGEGPGAGARAEPDAIERPWRSLAEMGVLAVAVPEAAGGLGLGPLDWVLLAEEAGYAAVPHPFVETVAVVAPLLAELGDPTGEIDSIVGGSTLVTAELTGHGPIPWGRRADRALARLGEELRLLDRAALAGAGDGPEPAQLSQVAAEAVAVDGSRDLVAVDRSALAGVGTAVPAPADAAAAAFDRGALGTAAQLIGLSRRMLDLTVAYVVERQQFGVPIGSFQAVKHHLADARLQVEFAAPAVYAAAWSLATGQADAPRDVSMAKALASDAARVVGRKALQCHGAIGYTVEYDLHLSFKRAFALAASWGDAAWHRDRVGRSLGV
jgi:alkylation response protein AidB-like acyl-CoA dehydrogenase